MPTVSKQIADQIIAKDGIFGSQEEGFDPRVIHVTVYENAFNGDLAYGLTYEGRENLYTPSPYVRNPRTYWKFDPDK